MSRKAHARGGRRRKSGLQAEVQPSDIDLFGEGPEEDSLSPIFKFEQMQRAMHLHLEGLQFADEDEKQHYLQHWIGVRSYRELVAEYEDDPIEVAQALAFRAMDSEFQEDAIDLARRALALDPDCIDAQTCLVLAETDKIDEAIDQLRGILAAAEARLREAFIAAQAGHFLSSLRIRPHARTCLELVRLLLEEQRQQEAIDVCRNAVQLNPQDTDDLREVLLGLLLATGDVAGAQELIGAHPHDTGAVFLYGRVLARLLAGDQAGAQEALQRAYAANYHAYRYLVGQAHAVPHMQGGYPTPGSPQEALHCLRILDDALGTIPGVFDWLRQATISVPRKKRR